MARHARSGPVRDLLKHRLVVAGCVLGALGAFGLAYAERRDHASVLLWSGFAVFLAAMTVIVASLSIGPVPFAASAWELGPLSGRRVQAWVGWVGTRTRSQAGEGS